MSSSLFTLSSTIDKFKKSRISQGLPASQDSPSLPWHARNIIVSYLSESPRRYTFPRSFLNKSVFCKFIITIVFLWRWKVQTGRCNYGSIRGWLQARRVRFIIVRHSASISHTGTVHIAVIYFHNISTVYIHVDCALKATMAHFHKISTAAAVHNCEPQWHDINHNSSFSPCTLLNIL